MLRKENENVRDQLNKKCQDTFYNLNFLQCQKLKIRKYINETHITMAHTKNNNL